MKEGREPRHKRGSGGYHLLPRFVHARRWVTTKGKRVRQRGYTRCLVSYTRGKGRQAHEAAGYPAASFVSICVNGTGYPLPRPHLFASTRAVVIQATSTPSHVG
jgi:hypothetical protein